MITCHSCGGRNTVAGVTEYLIAQAKANNRSPIAGLGFTERIHTIQVDGKTTAKLVNGRWMRLYRKR